MYTFVTSNIIARKYEPRLLMHLRHKMELDRKQEIAFALRPTSARHMPWRNLHDASQRME